MSVDKFGRYKSASVRVPQIQLKYNNENTLKLTEEGDYDLKSKRLTNIAYPQHDTDACSKFYVDSQLAVLDLGIEMYIKNTLYGLNAGLDEHIVTTRKEIELLKEENRRKSTVEN